MRILLTLALCVTSHGSFASGPDYALHDPIVVPKPVYDAYMAAQAVQEVEPAETCTEYRVEKYQTTIPHLYIPYISGEYEWPDGGPVAFDPSSGVVTTITGYNCGYEDYAGSPIYTGGNGGDVSPNIPAVPLPPAFYVLSAALVVLYKIGRKKNDDSRI